MTAPELLYQLETDILVTIARYMAQGQSLEAIDWQTLKLQQLGRFNAEAAELIAKYQKEIQAAIDDQINGTAEATFTDINKRLYSAGVVTLDSLSAPMRQSVSAWVKIARSDVNIALAQMAENAGQVYAEIASRSALSVITGQQSVREAIAKSVSEYTEQGLTAFVDKANREWSPEGYAQMVVRSNQRRVATQISLDAAEEYGTDLIEVSSHLGARPLCEPWQGKILSLHGKTQGYTRLDQTSYGEPAGLFGINCGHVMYPFFPGLSEKSNRTNQTTEENAETYKESQQQRYYERQIRAAKRDEKVADSMGDDVQSANARYRQQEYEKKLEEMSRTRRKDREEIYG